MLRVSCDCCGKELRPGHDHFVVKIEVFAAHDPSVLTEEDLDEDHLEQVADLLRQMEEGEEPEAVEPATKLLRYDLCPVCRKRYLRDPLGREASQTLHFSEN